MRKTFLLAALLLPTAVALAESGTATPMKDDIPLATYLDTLERIAPAAREGAEVYLDAFRRRCGRPLDTIELRKAFADGSGDPVLMEMILAAFQRDALKLRRLADGISCVRRM